MADSSYRSLLTPPEELSKRRSSRPGHESSFKTPLYAFSLLILLLGCIAASVTVLITSHEEHVKAWKFQPSVWLSFLTSVYTIGLGALFFIGVAVTWWRSLTHGTSLKRLHFISAGATPEDFGAAFMAGGHARRVALAAMIVFIVKVAIGPIMQRATRPKNQTVSSEVDMNIYIAETIPDGWYGRWNHFDYTAINIFQETLLVNTTITTSLEDGFYCEGNGTCSGSVYGAGHNYGCTQDNRTMDLHPKNAGETVFKMDFNLTTAFGPPMLQILVEYVSAVDDSCTGTITTESCYLVPATVWYPIQIINTTLTMDLNTHLVNHTIVRNYTSEADIPPKEGGNLSQPMGPLKGALEFLKPVFTSEAILSYEGGKLGWIAPDKPHLADHWITTFADGSAKDKYPDECPVVFNKPTVSVLMYVTDYMFRSAYAAATRDDKDLQSFTANFIGTELWHITGFRWLAASVTFMVVGILAATSLLWGWWQLSRYVTLSPLETGKALGAPIFHGAGPEQEANYILREVGQERVAHDGHELVWNGTVYATGLSSQHNSLREMDSAPSGKSSLGSRGRGHRQGMSSIDEEFEPGFHTAPPAFAHAPGVSTRRWDSGDMEMNNMGRYARQRSNSGGVGAGHDDTESLLLPQPLTMTSERSGALRSPPMHPSPELREEGFSARFGRPRQASGGPLRPLSPMYGMETGMVMGGSTSSAITAATSAAATGGPHDDSSDPKPKRKMSLLDEISRRAPE
jgi:hypothetical protein